MLNDKRILVTGATGSFGRQFIRTVLSRYRPARLVVYSRDELKQYEMQSSGDFQAPCLRYFIGDIRDADRLEMALQGIDYVVHAAALKQVPAAEYNPLECVRTNILGAANVVQAAIRAKVRKVIALSTDKAASPVNLYGASKLASDKIFIAANNLSGKDGTRFAAVRYGNVLGSRGSVLPFFRKLVETGATVLPITDPRMTRFWITLEQGVEFVLTALDDMEGGEIFVPKIASMRIVDLAECVAPGLPHEIVGIRPGEKLHETLITVDDARTTHDGGDRYVIVPALRDWTAEPSRHAGQPKVPEGFHYSSDNNEAWLGVDDLRRILEANGL